MDYVFSCLKDGWKDAYGLSGVIATVAVSVALIVADAAVALIEGVSALVDAVRYFSGYQITVASLGPPCAPQELLPKDGNGEQWTMLNYACLDGYALAVAKTTFTAGGSPSEDGVATFRAVGNEWVIYGGWDDGVCLLGTPAVCGGLARAPGTEPPHDILVQLVHAAGLSVSSNGANIQSPTS